MARINVTTTATTAAVTLAGQPRGSMAINGVSSASTSFTPSVVPPTATTARANSQAQVEQAKNKVSFSKVQYLPVMTMANISSVTVRNVSHWGMLKSDMACIMPMYSVIRVNQLISARSKMENHPQKEPKASKMASAWPRLVTAQPHRHFLDVVGHGHENDERPEQIEPGLGPRFSVGRDPPGVVVGHHRDDARADDRQEDQCTAAESTQPVNAFAEPIHGGRAGDSRSRGEKLRFPALRSNGAMGAMA